jgi:hypothetical protein
MHSGNGLLTCWERFVCLAEMVGVYRYSTCNKRAESREIRGTEVYKTGIGLSVNWRVVVL